MHPSSKPLLYIFFLHFQRERIQWYDGGVDEHEDERIKNLEINWWPRLKFYHQKHPLKTSNISE